MIRTYQRKKLTHDRALIFDRFFVLFVIFVHLSRKKVWIMTLKVQFADIWPLSGHFLVLLVLEMDFDNRQSLLLSHHCALSRL
jgi:hypothetical protein